MYNQLFQVKPPIDLILTCLQYLGFTSLQDNTEIPRIKMELGGAVHKFITLLPRLIDVYIPCKFELFCRKSLDINACITITRQLLKSIGYDFVSRECIVNGVRMQKYAVMTINAKIIKKKSLEPEHKQKPIVVSFN